MAKIAQHDDFGEKIGGAKKDLWKQRGLFITDLDDMNEREADKYVKKDNVWPKPDYDALISGGVPADAAYFIKTVRDSLNAAPRYYRGDDSPEKHLFRQKQYIETVREIKEATERVTSREDAMRVFSKTLLEGGYVERSGNLPNRYSLTEKGRSNPVVTDRLFRALSNTSEYQYERNIVQKAVREQFGVPKEQKIPKGYDIRFAGEAQNYHRDDMTPNTYFVISAKKGFHRILETGFESREAALAWAKEDASMRRGSKKRFTPEQLVHIKRTGFDYRTGKDAAGEDYISLFGFRGGEFGNWMSQNDRQVSLNMGFDALKDLADALRVTDKDISCSGVLAIAFGARGSGSAVAHYEPVRKVINLTKMRGAGSLAHEWWHGFDDFLGHDLGAKGFLSENQRAYPAMAKLVETMKYKPETLEQATARTLAQDERTRQTAERWIDRTVSYSADRHSDESLHAEYAAIKESFLNGEAGSADRLSSFKKSVTGHVIPKEDRDTLMHYERILGSAKNRGEVMIGRRETDFYINSKKMNRSFEKDGGYWDSNTEMTARAFAAYVMDNVPCRSDYLAGHAESAVNLTTAPDGGIEVLRAFPVGEERADINAAFDDLIADLKRDHRLTHEDRPDAELVSASYELLRTEQTALPVAADTKPSVTGSLAAAKESTKITAIKEGSGKARNAAAPEL